MRALSLALAVVAASCAPAAPPPKAVPPAPAPKVEAWPLHPARWVLRPEPSFRPLAQLALGDGRTLWVGAAGERWIVAPNKPPEPAETLLPEALVGVVSLGKGGFSFVGRSGHVHRTETALGALRLSLPPPHAVRRVAAGKAAIVAITADDRLLRSTDGGETWNQVTVAGDVVAWADVALSGSQGLLLGMPHRLFRTEDDGATFAPLAAGGGSTGWLTVDAAGALVVNGTPTRTLKGGALVTAPSPKLPTLGVERYEVRTSFSGTHLFTVENRADYGKKKEWVLVVQRLVEKAGQAPPAPVEHPLHALDHCDHLDLGSLDDVVELACDALVDDGDKKVRGIALHRSTDAGKTFVKDGAAIEASMAAPVVGPNGYVLLPGQCHAQPPKYFGKKKPGPSSPASVTCTQSWERRTATGPFAPSERETTTAVVALDQGRAHLVALSFEKDAAVLERRHFDGKVEVVTKLPGLSQWLVPRTTVHSDGTRVVLAVADSSGVEIRRSLDGGVTFTSHRVVGAQRLAVAGQRMLLSGPNLLAESDDGGATFTEVEHAEGATALGCNAFGCATSRGLRIGFDLPGATPRPAPAPPAKRWATPLACKPTSPFAPLGLGELPRVEAVEPTASVRLAWPRRKEDGTVDLLVVDRAGKTVTHPLLGPAPHGPEDRSQTRVHVQPHGVVAVRYSYVRKSPGKYGLSPVDAQIAYLPWATGKVQHVSLPKVGTWRVPHDPAGPMATTEPYPADDVLAIEGPGLFYRTPYGTDPVRYFQAGKPVELIETPEAVSGLSFLPFHALGGHVGLTATSELWLRKKKGAPWVERPWSLWSIGVSADQAIEPVVLDGALHLAVSFRGDLTTPGAHFAVPVEDRDEPGKTQTLPLPTDPPKACPDANGPRLHLPAPRGLRHPLLVEGGSVDGASGPLVLATDDVVLRGTGGNACEAALVAVPPNHGEDTEDFVAVVRPGALDAVTLYRADRSVWPNRISTRTLSCAWAPGPLPEALAHAPGF